MDIIETFGKAGVIPVIVIEDVEKAVPLAKALVRGGLPVLEVTFRTECAAEAIKRIKREVPEAILAAGTVVTRKQLMEAKEAGVVACVSPGFDSKIVETAQEIGMPFCPGVATASELTQALSLGLKLVKFFPAESAGGVKYIKDLLGAFRWTGVRFMPTGGIKPSNLSDYLSVPEIICCGGTWIVPKEAIISEDWAMIEKLAADAVLLAAKMR